MPKAPIQINVGERLQLALSCQSIMQKSTQAYVSNQAFFDFTLNQYLPKPVE
ncbi:hypothetical protein [Glaciecola sp. MF2-115]|uniref:hypothetical protein n=1 Tax=Glaciecola sp. MF2-115 TaxID=3384827 RepID=UPI0039A36021